MAEVINLTYRAELRQLTEQLSKVEGINAGLAKKMANDLDRSFKAAGKSASKAASQMEVDTKKAFGSIKGASVAAFGPLGERLNHLAGVWQGIGASSTVALAAGVVGAAALAVGIVGIVDRASDARKRLEEMGLASLLPEDATAGIAEYDAAVRGLSVSTDLATVQLGSLFAPALANVADNAAGVASALSDLGSGEMATTRAAVADLTEGSVKLLDFWLTLGYGSDLLGVDLDALTDRAEGLKTSIASLTGEASSLTDEVRDQLTAMGMLVDEVGEAENRTDDAAKAQRAYAAAVSEAAAEINETAKMERARSEGHAAAIAALRDLEAAATAETATDTEKIEATYDARIEKIHELAKATGDLDAIQGATAAAEEARQSALLALDVKRKEEKAADNKQALDDALALGAAYAQTTLGVLDAGAAAFDTYIQIQTNATAALEADIASREDMTEFERAQMQARADEHRKKAMAAFEASKAVAIAQAEMSSALAAIQAYTAVVGLIPVGPVLAPIAAGAALAFGMAQSVAIASQPPPAFHSGGFTDDVPTTLLRGEAVLSRRGRATIGDDMIEAANRGTTRPMGGGDRAINPQIVYQHRAFAPFLRDFAAAGGLAPYLPTRKAPIAHRIR